MTIAVLSIGISIVILGFLSIYYSKECTIDCPPPALFIGLAIIQIGIIVIILYFKRRD